MSGERRCLVVGGDPAVTAGVAAIIELAPGLVCGGVLEPAGLTARRWPWAPGACWAYHQMRMSWCGRSAVPPVPASSRNPAGRRAAWSRSWGRRVDAA